MRDIYSSTGIIIVHAIVHWIKQGRNSLGGRIADSLCFSVNFDPGKGRGGDGGEGGWVGAIVHRLNTAFRRGCYLFLSGKPSGFSVRARATPSRRIIMLGKHHYASDGRERPVRLNPRCFSIRAQNTIEFHTGAFLIFFSLFSRSSAGSLASFALRRARAGKR